MDEEKQEVEKPPTEDTGEGDKPESFEAIDRANEAAERLEKANEKQENLIKRQERLLVESRLGGRSEAGKPQVQAVKQTEEEFAEEVMDGSKGNIMFPKKDE